MWGSNDGVLFVIYATVVLMISRSSEILVDSCVDVYIYHVTVVDTVKEVPT